MTLRPNQIGGARESLEVIDKIRLTYDTDYVDTLLVHCTIKTRLGRRAPSA